MLMRTASQPRSVLTFGVGLGLVLLTFSPIVPGAAGDPVTGCTDPNPVGPAPGEEYVACVQQWTLDLPWETLIWLERYLCGLGICP